MGHHKMPLAKQDMSNIEQRSEKFGSKTVHSNHNYCTPAESYGSVLSVFQTLPIRALKQRAKVLPRCGWSSRPARLRCSPAVWLDAGQPCAMTLTVGSILTSKHLIRNRIAGRNGRPRLLVQGSSDALPRISIRLSRERRRSRTCSLTVLHSFWTDVSSESM